MMPGSQRSTARETHLGLVTDNLAEANMDEETVAGWPVPASDKNLNRFYEASQKTKGDYPGMLQYREYGWNNVSESIRVELSPSYTIEMRSRLVGRETSAQMWKKSSGESTDAVTKDIFDTVIKLLYQRLVLASCLVIGPCWMAAYVVRGLDDSSSYHM